MTETPARVWIAECEAGLVVHATEAGARAAALEGWEAIKDDDEPDGPYEWALPDENDYMTRLLIKGARYVRDTGFGVYPAEVHTP